MRLIMIGTGPFGVPTFRALCATPHQMAALVTGPVRIHRGKIAPPASPIRQIAQQHGTPVLDPEDINAAAAQARLRDLAADLLIVCDFGQILSAASLGVARWGGLNLHGSLLPKYRGAAPINWAVYHGEVLSGVSVIHMTPQVDAGPCILQASTPIGPDETAEQLEPRLAQLGAGLVVRAVEAIESGEARAMPQDPALASKAPRLKKSDGVVDWSRPAEAIKNQIRALEPWPRTYTFWRRQEGPPVRLILGPVAVVEQGGPDVSPGRVIEAEGERLVIAAGTGAVAPKGIQPSGGRMMGVDEFLRGHPVRPGDRFGPE